MLRRLSYALVFFVAVVIVGTAGYVVLERWGFLDSLYMTVITIGSVGFGEVHPLSLAGRIWTMIVIVAGVGSLGFAVVTATDFMVEGHFTGLLEGRRMQRRIEAMSGHHIIAGMGRVGSVAAEEFDEKGVEFVVVDTGAEALALAKERGWAYVAGDATEEDVLKEAGIHRAKSLMAALDGDAANLFVTLTARGMNPDLVILARAASRSAEPKLVRAGADRVITPTEIGGRRMAAMVLRPVVSDYLDIVSRGGDVELKLEQIELTDEDPYVGLSIGRAHVRSTTGVYVLAVQSHAGQVNTNPSPQTVMHAGDRLVVLGTESQLRDFSSRACAVPDVCYPEDR